MCDAFLTLAQTDKGLTCFLLPRHRPDDTPQLKVSIDDRKAGALSLTTSDINATLSTALDRILGPSS